MSNLVSTEEYREAEQDELIPAGAEYGIGYKDGVIPHRAHFDFHNSRHAWGHRTLYIKKAI